MSYSQALEEQIKLLRSVQSGHSARAMRAITHGGGRYGQIIRDRRIDPLTLPRTHWEDQASTALELATPYYWAGPICRLVDAVATDMPPWRLTAEALPTPDGFFWLAEPIKLPRFNQDTWLRAVTWTTVRRMLSGPRDARSPDGIAVTTWARISDLADLMPFHNLDWWFGESTVEAVGRYPDEMTERKSETFRVLAAMFAFLEQRILIAPQEVAERHARRRLEREGFRHEPLIRVVELRRKQARSEHHGDSGPIEWSHQWIVSGFWRQQWYPSLGAHQPRWIMPYIKGPADKPLKPPRAKVFAVIR